MWDGELINGLVMCTSNYFGLPVTLKIFLCKNYVAIFSSIAKEQTFKLHINHVA